MSKPLNSEISGARGPVRRHLLSGVIPRRKSCEPCRKMRVRCDQNRPVCSRCVKRRVICVYLASPGQNHPDGLYLDNSRELLKNDSLDSSPQTIGGMSSFTSSVISPAEPSSSTSSEVSRTQPQGDGFEHGSRHRTLESPSEHRNIYWSGDMVRFTELQLVFTLDPSKIRDRWLAQFIPSFNDKVKLHPPGVIHFVDRVFRTYPTMLVKAGHLPPYIHPSQLAGQELLTPLANCLSLVRLWDGQLRGGEMIVRDTIQNEMNRLYRERQSYGHMELLAAFQAYLTYGMMAYFSPDLNSLIDRQVIINLQDFGCEISSRGLVCPGELSHSRPDWESWIVASTKRRCLYTMYLFDNLFCTDHGLETFLGEELSSLPVPASKVLWECKSRATWEKEYNKFLTTWNDGGLTIDELFPPPDFGAEARKKRVSKWVESVDEFGMMLYAVCSVTHGS